MKKIVDVSGFGHSGKTAISDYLKSHPSVFGFPNYVEFELFRVPNGLIDLYFNLYESWNLIRSRVRVNEFKKLSHRIGRVQKRSDPFSYFLASGHGYNQYFNNKFIEISDAFVEKLILKTQKNTFWPYQNLLVSPINLFLNKFKTKFFNKLVSADLIYTDRNAFLEIVHEYLQLLFHEATNEQHTHILLNNAFDPFYPTPCLDMIGEGYSIIVDRDPRDIYASQIKPEDMYIPVYEQTKTANQIRQSFTGFNDIEYFIFRYKTLQKNIRHNEDKRILRIKYEDFVLKHQQFAPIVTNFVGLDNSNHSEKGLFDLEVSKKNIGIWKKYDHIPEIQQIEKELAAYCYTE